MSEKECIYREAAIRAVMWETSGEDKHTTAVLNTVAENLRKFPAAPVREVVTCGECVYWRQCYRERGFCDEIWNEWTNRDDFCSHGKWSNMREPVADIDVGRKEEGEAT